MRLALTCTFVCGLAASAAPAGEQPPAFAKKPTVSKDGERVKIEFAVDRETDVAVFVENGGGKVVRHLVAGVLGRNPPAPLKPGLSQSVEWDGLADYGKPAGAGPFKVRVALGLNVRYDKVLLRDANTLGLIQGLAVAPDGTLYVLTTNGGTIFRGDAVLAFNRDGTYYRTVAPFPSDLRADQVKDFEAFDLRGRPAPRVQSAYLQLYPFGRTATRANGMAVTPDGKAVMWTGADGTRVAAVGTGGDAVWKNPAGSPLPNTKGAVFLATSADGKWAYLTGAAGAPVVWRVPLPGRAPASPFFGDASRKGKDQTSLGGPPRGVAVDGKGNLLIADRDNDRVLVVSEADGKYVGEFAAAKPDWLAVDPASGAVYASSLTGKAGLSLTKFSSWRDGKSVATLNLPLGGDGYCAMAADCTTKPAIIWIGKDYSGLYRVEDLGGKFGDPRNVNTAASGGNGGFLDVTVDRFRPDREIYTRANRGTAAGGTWWYRFNEESGKVDKIDLGGFTGGGAPSIVAGPDGNLYGLVWPCNFFKWDRNGKPSPWGKPDHRETKGEGCPGKNWPANDSYIGAGMGDLRPMIGMRRDGHMFVLENALWGRDAKSLYEFLPSGERAGRDPVIWETSCAVSPRLDPAGNIYIAELVKPADWPYPPEMRNLAGTDAKAQAAHMYGSILKFGPKGGTVHWGFVKGDKTRPTVPFEGEPKLDPSLKTQNAGASRSSGEKMDPVKVTGAEWIHPGFSKIGLFACTCENMTFDVDEFGRVWFPDLNLYQVRVIDTNGNALTRFGGYGNAESCGPDSPVIDPATRKLRPRRADDPKDLKSPFAEPEIAFAWLVGVAATDRYVYTGDSINRRMLRSRIVYAAEESCEVR